MKRRLYLSDLRPGLRVFDRWWPDTIFGRVIKVTTRHAFIKTPTDVLRYDGPHCQFLSRGLPWQRK